MRVHFLKNLNYYAGINLNAQSGIPFLSFLQGTFLVKVKGTIS